MSYEELYTSTSEAFGSQPTALVRQFASLYPSHTRVLDIGAGQGRNALFLAQEGYQVRAVEPTSAGSELIRERAESLSLPVVVHQQIIQDFNSEADKLDAIIAIGLFPFLRMSEIRILVERMSTWLRPQGVVVIAAFTTEDPAFPMAKSVGEEVEKNVFSFEGGTSLSFFEPGEMLDVFGHWESVVYEEKTGKPHRHGDGPIHHHCAALGIFRKP